MGQELGRLFGDPPSGGLAGSQGKCQQKDDWTPDLFQVFYIPPFPSCPDEAGDPLCALQHPVVTPTTARPSVLSNPFSLSLGSPWGACNHLPAWPQQQALSRLSAEIIFMHQAEKTGCILADL